MCPRHFLFVQSSKLSPHRDILLGRKCPRHPLEAVGRRSSHLAAAGRGPRWCLPSILSHRDNEFQGAAVCICSLKAYNSLVLGVEKNHNCHFTSTWPAMKVLATALQLCWWVETDYVQMLTFLSPLSLHLITEILNAGTWLSGLCWGIAWTAVLQVPCPWGHPYQLLMS